MSKTKFITLSIINLSIAVSMAVIYATHAEADTNVDRVAISEAIYQSIGK